MGDAYYAHSTMPRASLVTTTKKTIKASQALMDLLRRKTGVSTKMGQTSKKMPPRRIPPRHKVDTLPPNQSIDPFREMNTYLNYEELMEEEEEDVLLNDAVQEPSVVAVATLGDKASGLLPWTDQEAELQHSMALQKKAGKTCGAEFFLSALTTLRIYKAGIVSIDKAFEALENVTEITLSGNAIQVLEHLPPKTEVVQVQFNAITTISSLSHLSSLAHLGLSYNHLADISSLEQELPELRSVDLGYNHLTQRDPALAVLSRFEKLRNLVLAGNPCTMVPFYRHDVVAELGGTKGDERLRWLDDVTIGSQEREAASEPRRAEQRAEPLQFQLHCETIEALDRLNENLPADADVIPEGPWSQEGENVPPPPTVVHGYVIEVDCLGHKVRSAVVSTEEAVGSVKLLLPAEEQPEPEEGAEESEPPPPQEMKLQLDGWEPSVEVRDSIRGKGIEVHILRVSTFSHAANEAFYAALPVAEGASEEEIAAARALPPDTSTETLLRVAGGDISGLLDGLVELQVEGKMYGGKVVDTARLDNYGIMCENAASANTDAFQRTPQMLKMRVQVRHDWVDPDLVEPEPEPVEEEDPKKGKKK